MPLAHVMVDTALYKRSGFRVSEYLRNHSLSKEAI